MTIKTMYTKLQKGGYNPEMITLYKHTNDPDSAYQAIRVLHDYSGPYPTKEILRLHSAIENLVMKAGMKAEQRGYYSATYIYPA